MAKKKYAKLKALMFEKDIRQVDLEPVIGRKIAYIATRMNGKAPWNTDEMRAIGELLGIPKEEWLDYFMEEPAPQNSGCRITLHSQFITAS
ncbi:hypothetical protein D5272_14300 [bacterium D16-76]|nr:hypothetical protein [bacterium D16-76]